MRVLETEEDLRWLAGGGDSTGFGVGRRCGDRRLWVIGWSWEPGYGLQFTEREVHERERHHTYRLF